MSFPDLAADLSVGMAISGGLPGLRCRLRMGGCVTVLMPARPDLAGFPLACRWPGRRRAALCGARVYIEMCGAVITLVFFGTEILGFMLPAAWHRIGCGGWVLTFFWAAACTVV